MHAINFPLTARRNDLPVELYTGYIRNEGGKVYILLKAGGIIADGGMVKSAGTSGTDIVVVGTTAATETVIGVNNVNGSALVLGEYFWALMKGRGYVKAAGTTFSAGDPLAPAAGGEAATIATGGSQVGIAILDRDATTTNNAVLFDLPSNYNG